MGRRYAKKNAYMIVERKREGKRSLGRPRCRCEENIKMDLREKGWGGMGWNNLARGRDQWRVIVNTVVNP
jgi:hypothetical protein